MTFVELLNQINSLHREEKLFVDGELNPQILDIYTANESLFNEEYFNTLETGLAAGNIAALNSTLGFLITNPIKDKEVPRFQNILIATFSITERHSGGAEMPVLLNFIWVMLDYAQRHWRISDEPSFFRAVARFVTFLEVQAAKYPKEVELLIHKIMSFTKTKS
jgi:hypothetical protein